MGGGNREGIIIVYERLEKGGKGKLRKEEEEQMVRRLDGGFFLSVNKKEI